MRNLVMRRLCVVVVFAATIGSDAFAQIGGRAPAPQALRTIVSEAIPEGGEICDAALLDSRTVAAPRLALASVDYSGRRFCNTVFVIRADTRAVVDRIKVWNVETLADVVRDLDNDGTPELIVPVALSEYEGAGCIARWPRILACSATGCSDRTGDFPGFYAAELDRAERAIAEAAANANAPDDTSACLVMERDKILRTLGTNANAGLETAATWMASPDARLRRKAISVFAELDDPRASAALASMARDRDSSVSLLAQVALQRKSPSRK